MGRVGSRTVQRDPGCMAGLAAAVVASAAAPPLPSASTLRLDSAIAVRKGHACAMSRMSPHDGHGSRGSRIAVWPRGLKAKGSVGPAVFVCLVGAISHSLACTLSRVCIRLHSPFTTRALSQPPSAWRSPPPTVAVRFERPSAPFPRRQSRDECGRSRCSGSWTAQPGGDSVGRRARRQSD